MAYGAIIAALIGAGGNVAASKKADGGKSLAPFNPIKFGRAARIDVLSTYFPEELGRFQISAAEARRLYRDNPASVHRVGPPLKRHKESKNGVRGSFSRHAKKFDIAASKIAERGNTRYGGMVQGPNTRFFRVPTSEEFSQIANKAFATATKEAEVNANRLRSSDLYRPLFERSEGRLGEFGRQLESATEDLASRALGQAATRGTLSNPTVAARATAPIALARATTRQQLIDGAQNQIRVLSAGGGLNTHLAGSLSKFGALRGQNLGAYTAGLGASQAGRNMSAGLLSDAGGSLGGAFGHLMQNGGGGGGGPYGKTNPPPGAGSGGAWWQ